MTLRLFLLIFFLSGVVVRAHIDAAKGLCLACDTKTVIGSRYFMIGKISTQVHEIRLDKKKILFFQVRAHSTDQSLGELCKESDCLKRETDGAILASDATNATQRV